MIVSFEPLLDLLDEPEAQYLIPVFQRVYSWNRMQCDQLWDDALHAAVQGKSHFAGTIICRPEKGEGKDRTASAQGSGRISLIDGQQRLTTVTLLLCALRDHWREEGERAKAQEMDEGYLHGASGALKLSLSEADGPTLAHLVDGAPVPADQEPSRFLMENHGLFKEKLASSADADAVFEGLRALQVVVVTLEDEDGPQQVFESLNAKGRPLSTTDLLRNVLVVKYGQEEQERLFDQYWSPIDEAFQRFGAEQDIYLDAALHSWLSKNAPDINATKRTDLYQAYKVYIAQSASLSLEDLLESISAECLAFAANPDAPDARKHLDWVVDKPEGLISERKIFGD